MQTSPTLGQSASLVQFSVTHTPSPLAKKWQLGILLEQSSLVWHFQIFRGSWVEEPQPSIVAIKPPKNIQAKKSLILEKWRLVNKKTGFFLQTSHWGNSPFFVKNKLQKWSQFVFSILARKLKLIRLIFLDQKIFLSNRVELNVTAFYQRPRNSIVVQKVKHAILDLSCETFLIMRWFCTSAKQKPWLWEGMWLERGERWVHFSHTSAKCQESFELLNPFFNFWVACWKIAYLKLKESGKF